MKPVVEGVHEKRNPVSGGSFPVESIRRDFPILSQTVHGHPLVYLDNAASSQKPQSVIDAVNHCYSSLNANVHRGVHLLSQLATTEYERSRSKVRSFINAGSDREIVFVKGTTEAINLVAFSIGETIGPGDEIVITTMEHHSNIVPWQLLCQRKGATLKVAPISDRGELLLDQFEQLLNPKTRLIAVGHISNSLGSINPIEEIVAMARQQGALVLVDGAQAVPHQSVDVAQLDCDFYCFSSHKMFGPTGVGVLYGKAELLESMTPYQGGGDMIRSVSFEGTTFNDLPHKFEAGTPNIAGCIGLGAAVDYLEGVGMEEITRYEAALLDYATEQLQGIPGLHLVGTASHKAAVVSFVMEGIHPHDIGTILDSEGIAIRTGHHCAQPVMERFKIPATARASFAFYNHRADVDALAQGLAKVRKVFS